MVVLPSIQPVELEEGFVQATRAVQVRKEKQSLVVMGNSF